jgi:hypothetical protein
MTKSKPNCYGCIYRGDVPGDAHSTCLHPATGMNGDMMDGLVNMISGKTTEAAIKLGIKGDAHGIRNMWFLWPANFDPVWLESCLGFKAKDKK